MLEKSIFRGGKLMNLMLGITIKLLGQIDVGEYLFLWGEIYVGLSQ